MADAEKIQNFFEESGEIPSTLEKDFQIPAPSVEANKEHFDTFMRGGGQATVVAAATERADKASLMDVVHDLNYGGPRSPVSMDGLIAQTKQATTKIESIKQTLEAPEAGIRSDTHVQLLENKLIHINDNLKLALSRVGSEFAPNEISETGGKPRVNPVERFLSFLSDGQYQLEHLGDELTRMSVNKEEIAPVAMLAVQVKVGQIQQELELFSNLLNQALQSIKTVMNIQV